jgi:glycosyltransferase involved in cell wall biosynthesis
MTQRTLTVAVCTFNRSRRLATLVAKLREQKCPIPFEILFVDNNSTDQTQSVLRKLASEPGVPLRCVKEPHQGIVAARNRALEECLNREFILFLDDDEIPRPGLLEAAFHALDQEMADCVGGRIEVIFGPRQRPQWLGEDLVGFLGQVDYGQSPFWIRDTSTPVFNGNIAYRTGVFAGNQELRFDKRYSRVGKDVGGGEDAKMFREMVKRGLKVRYRPDMVVEHHVDGWRLKRRYFIWLHFKAGLKSGRFEMPEFPRQILGIPPFLFRQALRQCLKTIQMWVRGDAGAMRQAMNGAHAIGQVVGRLHRS